MGPQFTQHSFNLASKWVQRVQQKFVEYSGKSRHGDTCAKPSR